MKAEGYNPYKEDCVPVLEQFMEWSKEAIVRRVVDFIDDQNKAGAHLVASGDLRKSIDGDVEKATTQYIDHIFSNVNYAVFAHEPTKPHWPPLEPLKRWVVRKKLSSGELKRGRKSIAKLAEQSEITRIAKRVQAIIAKKGTKGIKFLYIGLANAEPDIYKRWENLNFKPTASGSKP